MFFKTLFKTLPNTGILLISLIAVCLVITDSSITAAETPNLIYEGDFCRGYPCVELNIAQQNFTFLINTGIDYTIAETNVINLFPGQPEARTVKDCEGLDKQVDFYPPLIMRLGLKALNSGHRVGSVSVGRYKLLGVSGILGAREMTGLVWDLDFEHARIRVYNNRRSLDEALFPVKARIQGKHFTPPRPLTIVTVAGYTFPFELELLEPEDIQINHVYIQTLLESGDIVAPSMVVSRTFENGSKRGNKYRMTEGHTAVSLEGYDYNNVFTVYAGYDYHLGHGFFTKQKRVVIDLNEDRLWIIPNESLQGCLNESQ